MIRHSKGTALFLSGALALAMLAGCGNSDTTTSTTDAAVSASATTEAATAEPQETTAAPSEEANSEASASPETSPTSETVTATDEDETAALQLFNDLTGTYQELFPVILADEYKQIWLDNCAALVGEENAETSYETITSMATGKIYGEEAVATYKDGNGVYDCSFILGLSRVEFDGSTSTIKGYDANDAELFSHTYHYVGKSDIDFYEFESDDPDSGDFTYFCLAPDTSATTYHIEFRYGSDLTALSEFNTGAYAYWLAGGISTEYDQTMIENCIKLYCTENLSA